MALYAMADFHLSLSSGKPMDIFRSSFGKIMFAE